MPEHPGEFPFSGRSMEFHDRQDPPDRSNLDGRVTFQFRDRAKYLEFCESLRRSDIQVDIGAFQTVALPIRVLREGLDWSGTAVTKAYDKWRSHDEPGPDDDVIVLEKPFEPRQAPTREEVVGSLPRAQEYLASIWTEEPEKK